MHSDPLPMLAIKNQETDSMKQFLHIYQNPSTTFEAFSCNGQCTLTPLGVAIEMPGLKFEFVLKLLMTHTEQNLNTAYEIVDKLQKVRIRTNPLTHILARWDRFVPEEIRARTLKLLIAHGADPTAPALFEVTPMRPEDDVPPRLRELNAANGQSLMAFQMTCRHQAPAPFYFIKDMIERYDARFRPQDPVGVFAGYVLLNQSINPELLDQTMDFLCPLKECQLKGQKIAGGMIQPGEAAHGELRRVVQGFDQASGMNLLHVYVEHSSETTIADAVERLRMLCDVYGLSVFTPTLDGRDVSKLTTQRHMHRWKTDEWAFHMPEVATTVAVGELLQRHRALALAQSLRDWPLSVMYEIGRLSGLPIQGAHRLDEGLLEERRKLLVMKCPGRPFV